MAVVKGGVWTNIEDEILKASVSKYGLNQWARVSSLLARKTAKQCKARWSEWLDPSIRKIEWSREEDEKLLHLAKLLPTQWRTIAPIVGRTAQQCLERYQKLLDDAEAKESNDMGLTGPDGGETKAPSADDVRRLRPGELDPDPESKPARPDTVDLDEDEKEMLSEARARLANTQGKKAKRKARERQLDESKRLASLQKRRELKAAGINIKITTRKAGQMDYNADIPFEKAPASGFYDTQDEETLNERQREMFDPRKQQLANKRKGDAQEDEGDDRKRRKNDKTDGPSVSEAAKKAAQMQKVREAERSSKRRGLNLPAPQVGDNELEDIIKMGMAGDRASQIAGASDNESTRGLIGNYTGMMGSTPMRTPRAPQEEDRIANELRNARLRTETQSALLGGENPDLLEGDGTTGYQGIAPSKQQAATPNPLATPYRQVNGSADGATPSHLGPGATPIRTPRDNFRLNDQTPGALQLANQTPRDIRLAQKAAQESLRGRLAALPQPKETDWELELPEEQQEQLTAQGVTEEDAALRDERNAAIALANLRAEFARQSQAVQKALPRPVASSMDLDKMLKEALLLSDPTEQAIASEAALLIAHDIRTFASSAKPKANNASILQAISDDSLNQARLEIAMEIAASGSRPSNDFDIAWNVEHGDLLAPQLSAEPATFSSTFDMLATQLTDAATSASAIEKKLALHLGGYQQRSKTLRSKVVDAHAALEKTQRELELKRAVLANEDVASEERLEKLRQEVQAVATRERQAQEIYRERRAEVDSL